MNLLLNVTGEPLAAGVVENASGSSLPSGVAGESLEAGKSQERIAFSALLQHRLGMQDLSGKLQKKMGIEPAPLLDRVIAETDVASVLDFESNVQPLSASVSLQEPYTESAVDGTLALPGSLLAHQSVQVEQVTLDQASNAVLPGIIEPASGKPLPPWAVTEPPQFESGIELASTISTSHKAGNGLPTPSSVEPVPLPIASMDAAELAQNESSKQEQWMTRPSLTSFWRLSGDASVGDGATDLKHLPAKPSTSASSSNSSSEQNESRTENAFELEELLQWSKVLTRASAQRDASAESVVSKSTFSARSVEANASGAIFPLPVPSDKVSTNVAVLDKALPIFSERFADALGAQSLSLAKNGSMSAELRLDPPDLGPLDIQIDQDGLETKLHFIVHQSQTKEHVEAALHRLRDIFESGGLKLTDVTVEHRQAQSQGSANSEQNSSRENNGVRSSKQSETEQEKSSIRGPLRDLNSNLFDEYA